MSGSELKVTITTETIIKGILLLALFALLYILRDLVLIVLTAVVIASAIEPAAKWFVVRKVPRILSVLLVYLVVAGAFASVFFFLLPPLLNDASSLASTLPQVLDSVKIPGAIGESAVAQGFSLREMLQTAQQSLSSLSGGFVTTLSSIFGGLFSFILIIVFSFYFTVQETGVDDFLKVITPLRSQKYVLDLWRRSQVKIGLWMQGQLVLGLIVGVLVYLGLTIFGVPYAFLLAVIAALFELIPVFGSFLSAIPGIAIAYVDGGATLGLLVLGLYLIIQQFESNLIYPLVVKKIVGVPPLLVILALLIGGNLAGFLGVILSVPVAAVIQELVMDLERRRLKEGGA